MLCFVSKANLNLLLQCLYSGQGLFYKHNYLYAWFVYNAITGGLMFDLVWEAISRLERPGFCVLVLTCDGATPNHRLRKLHTAKDELTYKVPNVFATTSVLYI